MSLDTRFLSVSDIHREIEAGNIEPTLPGQQAREQIRALNGQLNAYITVLDPLKDTYLQAQPSSEKGLASIPTAVKDNLDLRGIRTTYGSKIYADNVPTTTAPAVSGLLEDGADLVGKTNMHEFALGGTTDNPHYGTCHNPWDKTRSPGGSSGGSAVSVATGMSTVALGSDTSGSIRLPASFCGVVGFKPTYGLVSSRGCFPEAWTLDTVGPIARCVADAAIVTDAISASPTSFAAHLPDDFSDLSNIKIGIMEDFFFSGVEEEVAQIVWDAIHTLEARGATLVPVEAPELEYSIWALTIIDTTETNAVHHRDLVSRPEDYGSDVHYLLQCGELPTGVDYAQAEAVRDRIRTKWASHFETCDVVAAPTLPMTAPVIGSGIDDLVLMRLLTPGSLLGIPNITVPCGTSNGLPVGIQFLGPANGDQDVLNAGAAVESFCGTQIPPMCRP